MVRGEGRRRRREKVKDWTTNWRQREWNALENEQQKSVVVMLDSCCIMLALFFNSWLVVCFTRSILFYTFKTNQKELVWSFPECSSEALQSCLTQWSSSPFSIDRALSHCCACVVLLLCCIHCYHNTTFPLPSPSPSPSRPPFPPNTLHYRSKLKVFPSHTHLCARATAKAAAPVFLKCFVFSFALFAFTSSAPNLVREQQQQQQSNEEKKELCNGFALGFTSGFILSLSLSLSSLFHLCLILISLLLRFAIVVVVVKVSSFRVRSIKLLFSLLPAPSKHRFFLSSFIGLWLNIEASLL